MSINQEIIESYEETPYPYLGYQQTHPDTSASIARLLGLQAPDVENCRVLEVGCAIGGNLVPMAYALPNSEFIGFDISPGQIETGQAIIDELGLSNIELRTLDIMDATVETLGKFDYIIAHGVYSWVPDDVRDQLLAMCRALLTDNGVANISYNVLPGWKMMGMLRDMMLHHTRDIDDPNKKVETSRELANFLVESVPKLNKGNVSFYSSYRDFLEGYNEFVLKGRDESSFPANLMLHDELAVINHAVYFHEFADHIAQHDLQYISESTLSKVMPSNLPQEVAQTMIGMSQDIIEMEQYMDFLYNRTFRQTLICHAECDVERRLSPNIDMMSGFYIASNAQLTTPNALFSDKGVARWKGTDGSEFATDHPVTKQAMAILLDNFPQSIPFPTLYKLVMQDIHSRVPDDETQANDMAVLSAHLLQMFTYSETLVELHTVETRCTTKISDRPQVSTVVRLLVAQGYNTVSNMRHQRVQLEPLGLLLIPLLDGEHSQRSLINHLKQWVADGKITFENKDGKTLTKAKLQSRIKKELNEQLRWFAHAALLVG
jgi:methyltransferase-like protein/predicted O-methyltransferase YrrM